MALKVVFRPEAEADLVGLYEYIAERAGYRIAGGYIDRIEKACMALATFPKRGTSRFRVLKTEVEIVTIAYAGRHFEDDV
ncbi:type II toxin-antitoxin system RelE/ParE family toxin [Bradyrhizobium japonicum]|uniref:type II toxin-antitoxin system RelE/ParE family toxin n=1 Tax=Bradyrhizobium japonicum TaxID=375 RepID=UPI001BAB79EA|nr:type II toxin-antitoxin system RelE/ParE family toxin [Bradyrhizobium japonicum]